MIRSMKDSKIEWAGKIPEHWREIPNKFLFYNSSEKVGDEAEHYQLLSLTTQGVKKKDKNATGGKVPLSYDNYQTVDVGDIIFCLFDLDCSAVFAGVSPYCGMITSAYDVLTPRDAALYNKYADYWFQYAFSNRYYKLYSKNIRFAVTNDVFGSILTIVPPLAEQKKIADFLDGKCAEIDELVQTEEKMIEELKAYKQSVITEAVTKGLDPTAPMKESGIEWIGEIPEDWGIIKLKYVAELITGHTPSTKDNNNFDGDINWYTPSDFIGHSISKSNRTISDHAVKGDKIRLFPKNSTLLIGIGATAGKVAIIEKEGYSNQQITAIIGKKCYNKYLFYIMLAARSTLEKNALYTTLPIINNSYLGTLIIPNVSSRIEQHKIADYLDEKCAKIDEMIAIRNEQIDQLKEYKKSLIYEYVTGKKEVV